MISSASHDILFQEGEPGVHFYSVLQGYVRLFRLNGEGREADMRICEPGDYARAGRPGHDARGSLLWALVGLAA